MVFVYYDGPRRISKARDLRRRQTKAEKILWDQVKNRQLGGFKIRRQQILNEFIIDFYCTDKRLCIEVDGPYHNDPVIKAKDKRRDEDLVEHGFSVLRFKNDEVIFDLHRVLTTILSTLQNLTSSSSTPLKHPTQGIANQGITEDRSPLP
jgi:very-short-patch-repair endonuclease